ncbi:Flp family type IVb pilin [Gymnodinialimonas ceratoperidinii]|uniref:Flp family type IVb pilin n=1 Tax=Gymnodinialimonas ceratoperidinii TaxID=2856823 RepID=A0A8F6TSH7_9RHOB|nr:Flp family type IVb pilin [Gymnodinialimonas ceratoperidinii]QXT38172.1 Flp family type IVb pilin [Gymnodinialimonas ceratoperidinii]
MTRLFNISPLSAFAKDESGATAIEYGLFAALIAAVIVGSVATLGTDTNSGFQTVSTAMQNANGESTTTEEETTVVPQ